jgi:hypothetical protein
MLNERRHVSVGVEPRESGGPPDEIEVTEAMLEAGYATGRFYDREDPEDWKLAAIYRAMHRASYGSGPSESGNTRSPSCG